ncbi:MAG: TRAP transporter substrate-binding protein DctP [Treponema sp.]|nr:TRAP transporter substrate-binding protein DctP [Treponema sp.]
MKKIAAALLILFFVSFGSVFAQRGTSNSQVTNIRFVSGLPRNSDWGRALDRLASDWARVTNNQVSVTMTHGSQMSETQMLTSLRSNSIQVAVFTSAGMFDICPAVMNLSVPFMIRNNAELDVVLNDVKPVLDSRVREEFVVITWSKAGWIYVFSNQAVFLPNDLRRLRLATSPELESMNTVFRRLNYNLVPTDLTNLGTRLASNMVSAFYLIPTLITPLNLHRGLHMLDLPLCPAMGAIVMNRVTWNQLSAANQQAIVRVSQQTAVEFDNAMARTESNAISTMERGGLVINRPTQAQQDTWRADMNNAMPSLIDLYDRDLFNRINGVLERYRSGR